MSGSRIVPLALLLALSFGCKKQTEPAPNPPPQEGPVACTMDAKVCPDGSAVGRQGPNCEFAPCPGETPEGEDPVACTKDAKVCPDGSAVGREGPNCEFAPCPGETPE